MASWSGTAARKIGLWWRDLPHFRRGLGIVWRASRGLTVAGVALLGLQGLLPVATVYLTRALVDGLAAAAAGSGGTWERARAPLELAALLAAILLITEVLQAAARWVRAAQSALVSDHISSLVHDKAVAVDLAYYESPAYFDQLHRIRYDVHARPAALVENVGALFQNALTLAAMVAVLARFGLWIPLALLVSTLPALAVVIRYAVRQHEWRLRTTSLERRAYYHDWVLTSQECAAELRILGLGEHFRGLYQELRARLRGERLALERNAGMAGLAGAASALLVTALAMALMVWRAAAGAASLGDLAMFYQAFAQGQRLMRALLETVGQIYTNSLFLSSLFEFLDLEARIVDRAGALSVPASPRYGIRFLGVAFRYPGGDRDVLEAFDLSLAAGKVAAVVGPNGAGKSTLVKLLCRLYDPTAGRIELDGVDLKDYSSEDLRRRITIVFQQPVRYSATFRENISLGNLPAAGEAEWVRAAALAAGADGIASRLPEGYDTALGKWFKGGVELSVGEWQRVALARALFRPAPIVLLDEPTSAMDSWAENDWMDRFRAFVGGRTALVITHRFTTAMRADVIHVMEEGRIVESGTHRELLALGGRYAKSWLSQMRHAGMEDR